MVLLKCCFPPPTPRCRSPTPLRAAALFALERTVSTGEPDLFPSCTCPGLVPISTCLHGNLRCVEFDQLSAPRRVRCRKLSTREHNRRPARKQKMHLGDKENPVHRAHAFFQVADSANSGFSCQFGGIVFCVKSKLFLIMSNGLFWKTQFPSLVSGNSGLEATGDTQRSSSWGQRCWERKQN